MAKRKRVSQSSHTVNKTERARDGPIVKEARRFEKFLNDKAHLHERESIIEDEIEELQKSEDDDKIRVTPQMRARMSKLKMQLNEISRVRTNAMRSLAFLCRNILQPTCLLSVFLHHTET